MHGLTLFSFFLFLTLFFFFLAPFSFFQESVVKAETDGKVSSPVKLKGASTFQLNAGRELEEFIANRVQF
jgi:hypothetical protein